MVVWLSYFYSSGRLSNKACTRRVGLCATYNHLLRLSSYLLSGFYPPRPQAGKANRWADTMQTRTDLELISLLNKGIVRILQIAPNYEVRLSNLLSYFHELEQICLTRRAANAPCAECGGEFLHKEGCSQELSFYEAAHR